MFKNRLTPKTAAELSSYKGESEDDAIMRLEADGWVIRAHPGGYTRDSNGKFHTNEVDTKDEKRAEGIQEATSGGAL